MNPLFAVVALRRRRVRRVCRSRRPEPLTFKHELIAALCSKLTLKAAPTPDDFRERYLSYLREVDLTIKHKPIGSFLRATDNGIFFKGAKSGVAATPADLPSDTDQ